MFDGSGIVHACQQMQESIDHKAQTPAWGNTPLSISILRYALAPFYTLACMSNMDKITQKGPDHNTPFRQQNLKGEGNVAFSKPRTIPTLKVLCRKHKCTINDLVLACLMKPIKQTTVEKDPENKET